MKYRFKIILGISLFIKYQIGFCQVDSSKDLQLNKALSHEIIEMGKVDQIAAYIRQGKYKNWPDEKWNNFKDSVFRANKKELKIYSINMAILDII